MAQLVSATQRPKTQSGKRRPGTQGSKSHGGQSPSESDSSRPSEHDPRRGCTAIRINGLELLSRSEKLRRQAITSSSQPSEHVRRGRDPVQQTQLEEDFFGAMYHSDADSESSSYWLRHVGSSGSEDSQQMTLERLISRTCVPCKGHPDPCKGHPDCVSVKWENSTSEAQPPRKRRKKKANPVPPRPRQLDASSASRQPAEQKRRVIDPSMHPALQLLQLRDTLPNSRFLR